MVLNLIETKANETRLKMDTDVQNEVLGAEMKMQKVSKELQYMDDTKVLKYI